MPYPGFGNVDKTRRVWFSDLTIFQVSVRLIWREVFWPRVENFVQLEKEKRG